MNINEVLDIIEVAIAFVHMIERVNSDSITEEIYKEEIEPKITRMIKYFCSLRWDIEENSILDYNDFRRVKLRSEGLFLEDILSELKKLLKERIKG